MEQIKVRKLEESNDTWLDGYASVFNQKSRLIFEDGKFFYEIIKEGAFNEVLQREDLNVKAVVNHDKEKLLGRTKSGTLLLSTDEKGLKYSIRMGNTILHKDTLEMVDRGDLAESSFKYTVRKGDSTFTRDENGDLLHIVNKVSGLYDVSLVDDGAFANTDVSIRSALDAFELEEKQRSITSELAEKKEYLKNLKEGII